MRVRVRAAVEFCMSALFYIVLLYEFHLKCVRKRDLVTRIARNQSSDHLSFIILF